MKPASTIAELTGRNVELMAKMETASYGPLAGQENRDAKVAACVLQILVTIWATRQEALLISWPKWISAGELLAMGKRFTEDSRAPLKTRTRSGVPSPGARASPGKTAPKNAQKCAHLPNEKPHRLSTTSMGLVR
jgi:hypothetical protein